MIKSIFKFIVLTILVLVVGAFALPYFIGKEKVVSFLEQEAFKNSDKKLKINGAVDFGFFPNVYVKLEDAIFSDSKGTKIPLKNFEVSLPFSTIISGDVKLNAKTDLNGTPIDGTLSFANYKEIIANKASQVSLDLSKPVPAKLTGILQLNGPEINYNNFTITHKTTSLTGNLSLKSSVGQKPVISIVTDGKFETADLEEVRRLADFKNYNSDQKLLSGKANGVFKIRTSGIEGADFQNNLSGKVSINLAEGKFYGINFDDVINSITSMQSIGYSADMNKFIELTSFSGNFDIQNGVIVSNDIKATSPIAKADSFGTINLPAKSLNLNIDLETEIKGAKASVPLVVKGPFASPSITPSLDRALMNNLQNVLANPDAYKNVVNEVGDLLKSKNPEDKAQKKQLQNDLINSIGGGLLGR
jgi:uncharacterized protein involved in outer membrane biogenesis